jgi:hypothetical protein
MRAFDRKGRPVWKVADSAMHVSAQQSHLLLLKSQRTAYRISKPWDVLILAAKDEEEVFP